MSCEIDTIVTHMHTYVQFLQTKAKPNRKSSKLDAALPSALARVIRHEERSSLSRSLQRLHRVHFGEKKYLQIINKRKKKKKPSYFRVKCLQIKKSQSKTKNETVASLSMCRAGGGEGRVTAAMIVSTLS